MRVCANIICAHHKHCCVYSLNLHLQLIEELEFIIEDTPEGELKDAQIQRYQQVLCINNQKLIISKLRQNALQHNVD